MAKKKVNDNVVNFEDLETNDDAVSAEFLGVKWGVRPASNPDYMRKFERLTKSIPKDRRGNLKISWVEMRKINCKAMAGTILVSWGDNLHVGGEPFPYSVENAEKVLLSSHPIFEFINAKSVEHEDYIKQNREDAAKN